MQTVRGTLKRGMKMGDVMHKEFELREATTGDLFDAEGDVPADQQLAFSGALICRQLVRIGTFEGPFVLGMLRKLSPSDFAILRKAQLEAESLGEA